MVPSRHAQASGSRQRLRAVPPCCVLLFGRWDPMSSRSSTRHRRPAPRRVVTRVDDDARRESWMRPRGTRTARQAAALPPVCFSEAWTIGDECCGAEAACGGMRIIARAVKPVRRRAVYEGSPQHARRLIFVRRSEYLTIPRPTAATWGSASIKRLSTRSGLESSYY